MKTSCVHYLGRSVTILAFLTTLSGARGDAQQIGRKSFDLEDGGTVKIVLGAGNIEITPWGRNTVKVNAVNDDDDLTVSKNGNTVLVRSWSDVDVQVSVPQRINLDLQCGSGDIQIDGSMSGSLKARTSGGEIGIRDFNGGVSVSTGGGGVMCGNIDGKVFVESAGGDLQMGNIKGDVDLETDGGDIEVKDVNKSITARTSGGSLLVGSVGGNVRLQTSGGDIEVGPVTGESTLESSGGNIIVHGGGGRIDASTSGGDLTLERVAGSFSGQTSAGNITASVIARGKRSDGKLSSGGGNILLEISPEASATIVATVHESGRWQDDEDESTITSDFPAVTYRKDSGNGEITATYRLNDGSGKITLDASMGSITIRKGAR